MGIFVRSKFGYQEVKLDDPTGSINSICESLGYHPDQCFTYFGDFDENFQVKRLSVEVFTDNIIFVMADSTKGPLNKIKVDYFMRNFKVREIFNSSETENILTNGIENESLTIDFLARVLKIENPSANGIFFVDPLGLYLFFNNGLLTDFRSADGLSTWAKRWKELNADFIAKYEKRARLYWGNKNDKIINELNVQAEAWASIPFVHVNEFIPIHTDSEGLTNFAMLEVCHYNKSMDFKEFEAINHGRYSEIENPESPDLRRYKLDRFIYEFTPDGLLIDFYQT